MVMMKNMVKTHLLLLFLVGVTSVAASSESELVEIAKLAEQAERPEDMVEYMKQLVHLSDTLTDEQRNLLSVAYKNVVGQRRSAWRITKAMEERNQDKGDEKSEELAREYRKEIEKELVEVCKDVLGLISKLLGTVDSTVKPVEEKVFYLKMRGDYLRYLAEIGATEKGEAGKSYEAAWKVADALPATHPIRLGLALNYSVYYYEIVNDAAKACKLAKKAFDDAISELDNLKEDSYKDSTLIMQLLRDNLTLWTAEQDGEPGDQ